MKTSNLIGLLAIGGAGYYLLTRQKKQMLVNTPITGTPITGTSITGTPITGTPIIGTPIIGTPIIGTPITGTSNTGTSNTGTPNTGTSNTGTSNTGTSNTGTSNTGTSNTGTPTPPVSTINSEQYKADLIIDDCNIPSVGWDNNIVENYIKSFNSSMTKMIINSDLKADGIYYKDSCGNILMKPSSSSITAEASLKSDGFYTKTGFGSAVPSVNYYVKNKKVYILPSKLIQDYKKKYLASYELYLKNLPKLDPSLATPSQFALYPTNGIWINPPQYIYSSHPVGWLEKAMAKTPTTALDVSNADFKFLVLNPRVRNKNNFYVDQFGNINSIPTELSVNGDSKAPFYEIAEYRVNHGIPF